MNMSPWNKDRVIGQNDHFRYLISGRSEAGLNWNVNAQFGSIQCLDAIAINGDASEWINKITPCGFIKGANYLKIRSDATSLPLLTKSA
nr:MULTISPECIES: hypothetical protein [unclassified Klebsiella]